MKKGIIWILAFGMLFALSAPGFSASFKVYPGAKLEDVYDAKQSEGGTKMPNAPKVIIFTTNDLFENVVAFYRGIAREYRTPGMWGKSGVAQLPVDRVGRLRPVPRDARHGEAPP